MKLNLNFYRSALLSCGLIFFFLLTANGQQNKPVSIENPDSPLLPNSKITYSDLIDLVFSPTGETDGRKSIPLRNIFGDYQNKIYEGDLGSIFLRSVWINVAGRKKLLLLINLVGDRNNIYEWGEMNVAALFEIDEKPRLIDAVDVQADRFAFFSEEQPVLPINPNTDAFLIVNHHFNSGDSYMNLSLISVVNGRFKLVLDDIPTLTGDNHCGLNYEEKARLALKRNPRSEFNDIIVNIKHIRHPGGIECEKKTRGYTRNYFHQFVWNKSRQKYSKLKAGK